jgi:hypothetical protein
MVDPTPILDGHGELLALTGVRTPDCRARAESLFPLRYPGPHHGQ